LLGHSLLGITGDLPDNGMIIVNSDRLYPANVTFNGGTVSGTGTIILNRPGAYALLNGTLTQAAGHTISGFGQIHAALTNNGVVNANLNVAGEGNVLELLTNNKTNNYLMVASAGCVLDIKGITITQGASGQLLADGGTVLMESGTTIQGGALDASGGGLFQVETSEIDGAVFDSLANNAMINVHARSVLGVAGGLPNDGTIVVNSDRGYPAALTFDGGTVSGTGSIILNRPGPYALLNGSLTQEAGHTISGAGQVNAALDNRGTVEANVGGQTLEVTGTVVQHSGASLTGGTWIALANAILAMTQGSNITTSQANVVLDGVGSRFDRINSLADNQGSFAIRNGRNFTTTGALANTGVLEVGRGCTLAVSGNLDQGAAGTLRVELAGSPGDPAAWGHVAGTGAGTVAGSLQVFFSRTATYTPADRWHFLHAAGGRSGQFSSRHFYNVPAGMMPAVEYQADGVDVVLQTAVAPENFADWLAQQDFQHEGDDEPLADPDGDTLSNLMEYALDLDPAVADPPAESTHAVTKAGTLWLWINMREPARADLTYSVCGSTDLVTWYDVAGKTGTGAWTWQGGGPERIDHLEPAPGRSPVEVGLPQPHESDPRAFLRLEVRLD